MKRKILIIVLALATVFASTLSYTPLGVKADSGFDSSYDSGGSDWGGSSDWDSSSNSHISGGGDVIFIIISIAIIIAIFTLPHKSSNKNEYKLDHTNEMPDEKVRKYIADFNKERFLEERFNDYKKIQEDWMNFNYEGLREKLTDELYNQYEMQLDTLKVKNEKNIMDSIAYHDSMITGINKENDQITVNMEMIVSQVDYIEQSGKTVRGDKWPWIVHYELTFVLSDKKLDICPNCGANLKNSSSNKCNYCGSIISSVGNKAVLSKKRCVK